jgi:hypothetical protein
MNEVAWCYLEGFGCKKDKVGLTVSDRGAFLVSDRETDSNFQFASARYYRLAEKAGNKTLGNTW